MCEPRKLACGGKGPCCHVGYSHRHCEHCDVVIDTRSYWPVAPYQHWPYWWTNAGGQVLPNTNRISWTFNGNTGNQASQTLNALAINSGGQNTLPEHACEVAQ